MAPPSWRGWRWQRDWKEGTGSVAVGSNYPLLLVDPQAAAARDCPTADAISFNELIERRHTKGIWGSWLGKISTGLRLVWMGRVGPCWTQEENNLEQIINWIGCFEICALFKKRSIGAVLICELCHHFFLPRLGPLYHHLIKFSPYFSP